METRRLRRSFAAFHEREKHDQNETTVYTLADAQLGIRNHIPYVGDQVERKTSIA